MKTEEEASKKWCPVTSDPHAGHSIKCIASDCMAWRVQILPNSGEINSEVGYCGLAGTAGLIRK